MSSSYVFRHTGSNPWWSVMHPTSSFFISSSRTFVSFQQTHFWPEVSAYNGHSCTYIFNYFFFSKAQWSILKLYLLWKKYLWCSVWHTYTTNDILYFQVYYYFYKWKKYKSENHVYFYENTCVICVEGLKFF